MFVPSHPAGKALPKPRSVVAPSAKAGGEGGNSRPIREPVNRHQAADTTAPQPPPKVQQPAPRSAYEPRPSRPSAGRYIASSSAPRFVIATQGGVTFQDDLHVGNGAGGYADQDEGQQQQQVYGQGMHEQYSNGNQGRNQGNFGNGHDSWMGHSQAQHTHQQHDDGAGSWSQQGGMPDQMGRGASSPIMMHQQPPSAAEGYEYGAQFAAQMTPPPATQRSYAPLPLLPSSPFMPTPQPQPPAMGSHGHYGLPAVLFPNQGAYPYPADGGWGLAQQQMQFMQQPPPLPQNPYPGTMGYGAPGMYPF